MEDVEIIHIPTLFWLNGNCISEYQFGFVCVHLFISPKSWASVESKTIYKLAGPLGICVCVCIRNEAKTLDNIEI